MRNELDCKPELAVEGTVRPSSVSFSPRFGTMHPLWPVARKRQSAIKGAAKIPYHVMFRASANSGKLFCASKSR